MKSTLIKSQRTRPTLLMRALVLTVGFIPVLPAQQSTPQKDPGASSQVSPTAPSATLKVATRMVTLQVSARDSKGHPVTGLTAADFQLFEQVPPKKEQRPQKIAAFQQVNVATIAAADKGAVQMPPGIYSNWVTMQKAAVAPTILLMDGLNTAVAAQMQVHRQMVKLLGSIPPDIPVAVFLLDRNLHLLQNFSTDRTLLRAAVDRALSLSGQELNPTDVRSDPDALSRIVEDNPPPPPPPPPSGGSGVVGAELMQTRNSAISAQVQQLQLFEREASTSLISIRIQTTLDAFRSIARHVAQYPGRKNLLWVASSFPLAIFPDSDFKFAGIGEFQDKFTTLANALADAKIAVYPMDPAGLEGQSFYDASSRPSAKNVAVGTQTGAVLMREERTRDSNQETMRHLAAETGGQVCVNNNDLADCVKKAVDDGSSYYELAYYPDAADWKGEFHRIILKTRQSGIHLSFRQGYYASSTPASQAEDAKHVQTELQEAACRDLLTSTAILLMVQQVPASAANQVKYFVAMDMSTLTLPQTADGRRLSVVVAACAMDKDGAPIQFLQQPSDATLSDQQFNALLAQHGFTRTLEFAPTPGTVRVRLLVRDNGSGKMGSVDLPFPGEPPSSAAKSGCAGPGPCDAPK
jgi:VWFA-related protein